MVPLERLELPTHGVETRCSNSTELKRYITYAEHPIVALSTCGTSIVYLLAEFEPLTMAYVLVLHIGFEPITRRF